MSHLVADIYKVLVTCTADPLRKKRILLAENGARTLKTSLFEAVHISSAAVCMQLTSSAAGKSLSSDNSLCRSEFDTPCDRLGMTLEGKVLEHLPYATPYNHEYEVHCELWGSSGPSLFVLSHPLLTVACSA